MQFEERIEPTKLAIEGSSCLRGFACYSHDHKTYDRESNYKYTTQQASNSRTPGQDAVSEPKISHVRTHSNFARRLKRLRRPDMHPVPNFEASQSASIPAPTPFVDEYMSLHHYE